MANHRNRVTMACKTCGKVIEPQASAAARGAAYCSRACYHTRNARPIELSEDGLTARVPLTSHGKVVAYATIDADDAPWAAQWSWGLTPRGDYAVRGGGVTMHRELLGLTSNDGLYGDHINRDTLDNRRSNLRAVTPLGNAQNVSLRADSTSGYRGVSWSQTRGMWWAYVHVQGKKVYSEYF